MPLEIVKSSLAYQGIELPYICAGLDVAVSSIPSIDEKMSVYYGCQVCLPYVVSTNPCKTDSCAES